MFFNVSNHPIFTEKSTWSKEQREIAKIIGGELVDIPFPAITPDMPNDQIMMIAREVARDLKGMSKNTLSAAMVAGEYATTIAIIAELQKVGIPCYFGQSERIAEEREENGQVVVVHKFVFRNFRKAPAIQLVEEE